MNAYNNPYENLYIYYLEGKFSSDACFNGAPYIGNWEEDGFSFLFFTEPSHDVVEKALLSNPDVTLLDQYRMTYQEWQGYDPQPIQIGDFIISPPWNQAPGGKACRSILLDPGVVFGTGTHPTTRDCLEAIDLAFKNNGAGTALDLGCGTGLLALAAAKIGCQKVIAMDLNFLAVKTTKRNVALNGMDDKILVVQGDADKFMDFASDLVISNIHYDVMIRLIQSKGFLEKKQFVLSGLMSRQARKIERMLAEFPVKIIRKWNSDGIWHTFYGQVVSVNKADAVS